MHTSPCFAHPCVYDGFGLAGPKQWELIPWPFCFPADISKAAFLGQVRAGSPVSGRTGFVCALGAMETSAGMGVAWLWPGRGDVLQLAARCSSSPQFPLRVLNFGSVLLQKKGCEMAPEGSKEGTAEKGDSVLQE